MKKLALNSTFRKLKIMASGPITSWQTEAETMEMVSDFTFGGSKITADGDCSHEMKRCLLLGRKVMINVDSILKSRDSTLPINKSYGFSSSHVWMWDLDCEESWVPKNWCFWTVALEKTLESPLDCKEIQPVHPKKSVLSVHWKDCCWSWNFNTFDTWCEKLTHLKRPWCWERLEVGGEWDDRGWDGWLSSPTQQTWVWVNSGNWWWTGRPGVLWFMGSQRVEHDWVTELNWTDHLHLGPRHFTTPKGNFEPINNHPPLNLSSFPGNY